MTRYHLLMLLLLPLASPATYNNCRISSSLDRQLYHRRVQQEPIGRRASTIISYPEILLDGPGRVITCIRCVDLSRKTFKNAYGQCRVIAGGVGHRFVKLLLTAPPGSGYDYDVRILGR